MDENTPPSQLAPVDDPVPSRPTLCLDRPREVLAWLPYQLHFWPHESVVLASVRGPGTDGELPAAASELGLVARTDLSIMGNPVGGRQAQVEMSRHLQRDGAHQALCAIYTEQPFAAVLRGEGPAGRTLSWWRSTPWADLGRSYLVGPERFRCVDCSAEPCCPHTGQPLEVLRDTQVAAWYVYQGQRYAERREVLVPDGHAAASTREAAAAAARHHLDRRPTHAGTQLRGWQREMARRWVALVQSCEPTAAGHQPSSSDKDEQVAPAESDHQPGPAETGAVLAALSDTWVRDAALLWSGTGQLLGETLREDVIDAVFSGRMRPQVTRVRAAERTLAVLSAQATDPWKTPVLTCQAWLAWWTGDGARANILLHRALETDPDYALARLLGTALANGIPPGWVRPARRAS